MNDEMKRVKLRPTSTRQSKKAGRQVGRHACTSTRTQNNLHIWICWLEGRFPCIRIMAFMNGSTQFISWKQSLSIHRYKLHTLIKSWSEANSHEYRHMRCMLFIVTTFAGSHQHSTFYFYHWRLRQTNEKKQRRKERKSRKWVWCIHNTCRWVNWFQ